MEDVWRDHERTDEIWLNLCCIHIVWICNIFLVVYSPHTPTQTCTHPHTDTHTRTHKDVNTLRYRHALTWTHAHINTHTDTYTHPRYTCKHTYTHAHTHPRHTHAHVHLHAQPCLCALVVTAEVQALICCCDRQPGEKDIKPPRIAWLSLWKAIHCGLWVQIECVYPLYWTRALKKKKNL